MPKSVLLIDGHNFLFRAYNVPFKFSHPSGVPLHVATVFLGQLRKYYSASAKLGDVERMYVVFDAVA